MGSVANQNPFAPYDNYRDCSLGICSIYCPQFCYLIFPPPPPSDDDDSAAPFSPLIIAIIGVLATAFLLVGYYTIVTRYCKRRGNDDRITSVGSEENRDESGRNQWQVGSGGLDESLIKTITVCKYKKGDGLIEGSECAVCLSDFQENESLRLLPKCSHAFHLPCIDTWLKSQSNCPLCRASVVALAHPVGPTSPAMVSTNSYEAHRPRDLVLVVEDDLERDNSHQEMVVLSNGGGGGGDDDDGEEGVEGYRRSVSLGAISPRRQLLVSDILRFEEIDEYMQGESDDYVWRGSGSSRGEESKCGGGGGNRSRDGVLLLRSPPVAMKRSVSTGRFMSRLHDKGKKCILPN